MKAASVSAAADGFNPNVEEGNVYAVAVQPDGKVLLAGDFKYIHPNGGTEGFLHQGLARVLPDGNNDASFNPQVTTDGVAGRVNTILVQPDGKILIGGKFKTVNDTARHNAARLNADGTLDASFDPNTAGTAASDTAPLDTSEVMAFALQSTGKILVGGGFRTVQPSNATPATVLHGLARFNADGTLDSTFKDRGLNGTVLAIAIQPVDDAIVIGGGFTQITGSTDKFNHIARLDKDGVLDTTFNPNANGSINAIVIQPDGRIVIGGAFGSLQPNGSDTVDNTRPRLARLEKTGLSDITFAPIPDGPVEALKLQADGRILVGGSFTSSSGGMVPYAGRLLPDGEVDITFSPAPNFAVHALDVQPDGSVILAGNFNAVTPSGASSIVRNRIARFSSTAALDTDFRPDVNGRLQTVAVDASGRMLVAGTFTSVAGETHTGLVRLKSDGTLDSSFRADTNSSVTVILPLSGGQILIGGNFTSVNNSQRAYVARLNTDGSVDPVFDVAPNANVTSIITQGDKIIIGGNFTTLSPHSTTEPITRVSLARLNADGTADLAFTAQTDQAVSMLLSQADGKFIVGGSFTSVLPTGLPPTQVGRFHLARFNADGTLDTAFTASIDGTVLAGVAQSDGQIVLVGSFSQFAGTGATASVTRNNVVRIKADGSVDTAFSPGANDVVTSILPVANGEFLIGGFFTSVTGTSGTAVGRNFIARLKSNGDFDETFDLGLDALPGNAVVGLAAGLNNKVVVGGAFTSLKTGTASVIARNRLAQISVDGTVDATFNSELSTGAGAPIETITQLTDGSVLVAGSFSSLDGAGASNLARFSADGAPVNSFYPNVDASAGKVRSVAQLPLRGETIATQRTGFAWLQANGEIRTGIVKGIDPLAFSSVRAIEVQPADGKILVSASVTRPPTDPTTSGIADYLVRFNADGSFDAGFEPLLNSTVLAIRVQPDGKILIGGSFTTVGNSSDSIRNYMARLNNNGTVDTSFNPNFGGGIAAIELQPDGKILVGGTFTTLAPNGQTTSTLRNNFVRLNSDGSLDTTFDPSPDSTVRAINVQPDGKILIGGLFGNLQPGATGTVTKRPGLALLNADGTLDSHDFAANGPVTKLVRQADGKIIVGGTFSEILGVGRNFLARLNTDLTLDTGFNPNPSGEVTGLSLQADGKILISGLFTALQPNSNVYEVESATPRHYAARLLADGNLDPSFNPNFDSTVEVIVAYPGGTILAGGTFTSIQPTGSVLVGGSFSRISGVAVANLALFSGDGSISSTFLPNPNDVVYATQVLSSGEFVVAGAFTKIGDTDRNRIARFTSSNSLDTGFDPNANDEIHALALQADGKFLLGGKFTTVGGVAHKYLARVNADGSVDSTFNPSVPGDVTAILAQTDQHILVLSAGGTGVANVISRFNPDGSPDSTFTAVNGTAAINAIALQTDGRIVVGGAFTAIAGATKSNLARLNANGTFDSSLTATPSGAVTAIMISPEGKIMIGGLFNAVDGLPRFGLARITQTTPVAYSFAANPERTTLTWTRTGPGPEISGAFFEGSNDGVTWTKLGSATRVTGTPNWAVSGLTLPVDANYFVRATGVTTGSSQGSSGLIESSGQVFLSALPVITSATVVNAVNGADFNYAIIASGSPTSYSASGLPAGLALSGNSISGTPTQTGTFNVTLTATNSLGSTTTTLTLIVAATGGSESNAGRLSNISVLSGVGSSNPIIAGFVLSGSNGTQTVLIRAIGPGLTDVGVTGVLASPHLKLYRAGGSDPITVADAWNSADTDVPAAASRLGALPTLRTGSADVAFLATLPAGAYTFHVTDNGTTGGYALAEIYDASTTSSSTEPRLVNISARGVTTGYSLVTGGFVVSGTTPKKMLIRGLGPALAAQGVTGVLADPQIELVRNVGGVNTVIARNDNWGTPVTVDAAYPAATAAEISAAGSTAGAQPELTADSADAVLLITLPPGVYTAAVRGADGGVGAAMVEVYEVD